MFRKRCASWITLFFFAAAGILPYFNAAADSGSVAPDLKISAESLTISPSAIKGGTSATFKAIVQNAGTANAGGFTVLFYIDNAQVGQKTVSSLLKGRTASVSVTFKIPESFEGNYNLKAAADPDNTISETDETNNEASKSFSVISNKPDLVVKPESISITPKNVKAGDNATIKATVANTGNSTAKQVVLRFMLGSAILGEKTISSVGSKSSGSASLTCKLPDTPGAGQKLKVAADPDNAVSEISEDNNAAETDINIDESYVDLSISADDMLISITNPKPGQNVKITATIRNKGNAEAKKFTAQIFAGSRKLAEKANMTAKANGSAVVQAYYTVPANFGGTDIFVVVDPDNAISEKDEKNNTALRVLSFTPPDVDLSVKGSPWTISPAGTITAGTKFTVSGRVYNFGTDKSEAATVSISMVKYQAAGQPANNTGSKNAGGTNETDAGTGKESGGTDKTNENTEKGSGKETGKESGGGGIKVGGNKTGPGEIKANPDKELLLFGEMLPRIEKELLHERISFAESSKRILTNLASCSVPSLPAGGSASISRQITLLADYDLSTCELEITVKSNTAIYEQKLENNTNIISFASRPRSKDISVADADISHTPSNRIVKAGENVTLKAVIRNNGTDDIKNLKVNILHNNMSAVQSAKLIKSRIISANIKAGQSYTMTETVQIPHTSDENPVLIVHLDPENQISESSEANNAGFHSVPVTPLTRDLRIEEFSPSILHPKPGETVTWKVTVRNCGNAEAGNTEAGGVKIGFFDEMNAETPAKMLLVGPIGPDEAVTKTFTWTWTLPTWIPYFKDYPVRIVADYENKINETDEQNNGKTYLLTLGVADLSPDESGVRIIGNINEGSEFSYGARICNNGYAVASGVKVKFLYYVQGQGGNSLMRLGESNLGDIYPGKASAVQLKARLPDSVKAGAHIGIVLIVDPDDAILELDELNNRAEKLAAVYEPYLPPSNDAGTPVVPPAGGEGQGGGAQDGSGAGGTPEQAPQDTDADDDLIPDSMETLYGTNINNPDCDGDGVVDGEDVSPLMNPQEPSWKEVQEKGMIRIKQPIMMFGLDGWVKRYSLEGIPPQLVYKQSYEDDGTKKSKMDAEHYKKALDKVFAGSGFTAFKLEDVEPADVKFAGSERTHDYQAESSAVYGADILHPNEYRFYYDFIEDFQFAYLKNSNEMRYPADDSYYRYLLFPVKLKAGYDQSITIQFKDSAMYQALNYQDDNNYKLPGFICAYYRSNNFDDDSNLPFYENIALAGIEKQDRFRASFALDEDYAVYDSCYLKITPVWIEKNGGRASYSPMLPSWNITGIRRDVIYMDNGQGNSRIVSVEIRDFSRLNESVSTPSQIYSREGMPAFKKQTGWLGAVEYSPGGGSGGGSAGYDVIEISQTICTVVEGADDNVSNVTSLVESFVTAHNKVEELEDLPDGHWARSPKYSGATAALSAAGGTASMVTNGIDAYVAYKDGDYVKTAYYVSTTAVSGIETAASLVKLGETVLGAGKAGRFGVLTSTKASAALAVAVGIVEVSYNAYLWSNTSDPILKSAYTEKIASSAIDTGISVAAVYVPHVMVFQATWSIGVEIYGAIFGHDFAYNVCQSPGTAFVFLGQYFTGCSVPSQWAQESYLTARDDAVEQININNGAFKEHFITVFIDPDL